jgi:multiple sugar transport system permease protein
MYGVADIANVHFIGLANYRALLADEVFLKACRNTLVFVLVGAPLNLGIALALALALDRYEGPGRAFLRVAFFTPAS